MSGRFLFGVVESTGLYIAYSAFRVESTSIGPKVAAGYTWAIIICFTVAVVQGRFTTNMFGVCCNRLVMGY